MEARAVAGSPHDSAFFGTTVERKKREEERMGTATSYTLKDVLTRNHKTTKKPNILRGEFGN